MVSSAVGLGRRTRCSPASSPGSRPTSRLADDVTAFLDDGDAPVLVTLGTSAATNAKQVFELMAAALDDLHLRGLFLVGDESNITGPLRNRPGVWPFVPLHLVLPRCRAVVHSASLGTTAAVARVRPSVARRTTAVRPDLERVSHRAARRRVGAQETVLDRVARTLVEQLVTDEQLRGERARRCRFDSPTRTAPPAPQTRSKPPSNGAAA